VEDFIDRLSRQGLISPEQLRKVLSRKPSSDITPVQRVIRSGLVDQQSLAVELSQHFSLQPVTPAEWPAKNILPDRISSRFIRENHVVPLRVENGSLVVAVSDPTADAVISSVRLAAEMPVTLKIASEAQILSAIERLGGNAAGETQGINGAAPSGENEDQLRDMALDAPVIELVNRLFRDASAARATDIHFEPTMGRTIVRRRVDGLLKETDSLQTDMGRAAVSRIKILTRLNIAERRLPQDGRARVRVGERDYDIRVATMPTIHGESLAVRFLSPTTQAPDIEQLGLTAANLKRLKEQAAHAHGMIAVTGPTGSGKTTTLAATLGFLNDPARKILTIEDPVEYQIEGINQIQVHPEIGLTFAKTIRSLLRHDPDIIMVGEMRDSETAAIGVNAALTGHLLLTTLHTNSAAGAITRLLDLGVQAYLVASTLRCSVAQRLVRRLCVNCRETYDASPDLLSQFPFEHSRKKALKLWRAKGCDHCGGSGYIGRSAIFEVMVIDDRIRQHIRPNVSADVIEKAAREAGMATMFADGLTKCTEGVTTLEELGRIVAEN
jgi:general secretion pathway protein E